MTRNVKRKPSAGIQMGNKGNQGSKVPIGIGPNIVAAIQHLLWHSWVLYFISVFIIICGWPRLPVVDKLWMSFWSFGAAVAQLALLSLPFGICFFFLSPSSSSASSSSSSSRTTPTTLPTSCYRANFRCFILTQWCALKA